MDEKNRMDFTGINRTFLSVCLQLYSLQEVYFIIKNLSINRILYINTLRIYKMFFFKQEKSLFFFTISALIFGGIYYLNLHRDRSKFADIDLNDPNYITIRISVIREIRSHRKFQVQCSNINVSSSYHKVQCSNLKVQRLKSSKAKGHL